MVTRYNLKSSREGLNSSDSGHTLGGGLLSLTFSRIVFRTLSETPHFLPDLVSTKDRCPGT